MSKTPEDPITYASAGVNYGALDPLKRLAQLRARTTTGNLERFGMREIEASRGETAYIWEEQDAYRAFVLECLGTKNRVADEVRTLTGRTHYDDLAQDTIAMSANDLSAVFAEPQVVNAYFAVGNSDWFSDEERSKDLIEGWVKACNMAGAVWGGGETPTLSGIIAPDSIDLAGSAIGIIKPKERLSLGDKLTINDTLLLVGSSGIHANGLSLARKIAQNIADEKNISLAQAYATQLSDGTMYGEALLQPTHIYAGLVRDLFEAGVDIHYMVNITGHGWMKLMRANREFTYVIDHIPQPQPVFQFIQEQSHNTDTTMYETFNMGAGFALYMPEKDVADAQQIALDNHSLQTLRAGHVVEGPRQVIIKPKNIVYKA
ncbi:phosphoribosylformylglycinamidine cyclo-ligase [Candidatus Roizmanbacteria bacterium]|nr:phosphoribosylformylglycinamidine cyclo-ligase [Candidatus Roizmanbacteria bacterium]